MSLTSLLILALGLVACWVSYSEDRKEKQSMGQLAPDDLTKFVSTYRMTRPVSDYPSALQGHAAVAIPARRRKMFSVGVLLLLIVGYMFIGP